jgi:hypothetical protein
VAAGFEAAAVFGFSAASLGGAFLGGKVSSYIFTSLSCFTSSTTTGFFFGTGFLVGGGFPKPPPPPNASNSSRLSKLYAPLGNGFSSSAPAYSLYISAFLFPPIGYSSNPLAFLFPPIGYSSNPLAFLFPPIG